MRAKLYCDISKDGIKSFDLGLLTEDDNLVIPLTAKTDAEADAQILHVVYILQLVTGKMIERLETQTEKEV